MTLRALLSLTTLPQYKRVRYWWYHYREGCHLQNAQVEKMKADEAMRNQAYFQKQAVIAKSKKFT